MVEFFNAVAHFDECWSLPEDEATADRIRTELCSRVAQLTEHDQFVFYFSGHGYPINTDSGKQEAICPVDFDESPRHALVATELIGLFRAMVPGARVTIIADCCYSGALTPKYVQWLSSATNSDLRGVDFDLDIRSPQLSESMALQLALTADVPALTLAAVAAAPNVPGLILVAACEAGRVAVPLRNGGINGVLTSYLLSELETAGGLAKSASATVAAVTQAVHGDGYDQVPQLNGDHRCFGDPLIRRP